MAKIRIGGRWSALAAIPLMLCLATAPNVAANAPDKPLGDSVSDYYEDAAVRFDQRDYEGAIIQLKNALQKQPDNLAARILIGRAYVEVGDGESAEKELTIALRAGGDDALIIVPLGQALLLQHKYNKLLERVTPGLRSIEIETVIRMMRGSAHIAARNLDAAEREYLAARELDAGGSNALLGLAEVAIYKYDYARAESHIEEALKRDPDNADAWSLQGDFKRARGDLPAAIESYGKAIALEPIQVESRRSRAAVLIDLSRLHEAQQDVDKLLELVPEDPHSIYLSALVIGRNGDGARAAIEMRRADNIIGDYEPDFVRNHLPTLLIAGAINFTLREVEDAVLYLEQFIIREPGHVGARRMLASLYSKRGDHDRAVRMLERIVGPNTKNARILTQFATALMRGGRHTEASRVFERAVELAPELAQIRTRLALNEISAGNSDQAVAGLQAALDRDADVMEHSIILALMHLRRREFDEALARAQDLMARHADNPFGANLAGAALWGKGEEDAARESFEAAIEMNADYAPAHLNLAKLDLRAGALDAAEARLISLLERELGGDAPVRSLAVIAERRGDTAKAIEWLERVTPTPEEGVQTRVQLVDLHIRAGNQRKALNLARSLETTNPGSLPVLMAVSRAAIAAGEMEMATLKLRRMVNVARESPHDLYRISQLQQRAEDVKGAYDTLSRTVFLDPSYLPALISLTRIEVSLGETKKALERADTIRGLYPALATGDLLAGDVLMQVKRFEEAATAYAQGMKKQEDGVLLLRLYLARSEVSDGEPPLDLLQDWLVRHPEDRLVKRSLAGEYARLGRVDEAVSLNEALLEDQPDDPVVLNNLAWLYQKSGKGDARKYAERAYALAPNQVRTIDTLGWILVQQGEVSQGLKLLRDAQARAAGDPNIGYHLAVALSKLGRMAEAKAQIQAVLNAGRDPEISAQAEALLKELAGG